MRKRLQTKKHSRRTHPTFRKSTNTRRSRKMTTVIKKPKCSKSGLMGDQEDIFTLDTCSKYRGGATAPAQPTATAASTTPTPAATVPVAPVATTITIPSMSAVTGLFNAKGGRRKRRQSKKKNSGKRRR